MRLGGPWRSIAGITNFGARAGTIAMTVGKDCEP
jgi:hypothetical protein